MNSFKDFGIKPTMKKFVGDKIKISKIINKEIIVLDHKIEDSKIYKERGSGKCLCLQISISNEKHVVFTGSTGLIDAIKQIPDNGFPFTTTIIKENERFEFN